MYPPHTGPAHSICPRVSTAVSTPRTTLAKSARLASGKPPPRRAVLFLPGDHGAKWPRIPDGRRFNWKQGSRRPAWVRGRDGNEKMTGLSRREGTAEEGHMAGRLHTGRQASGGQDTWGGVGEHSLLRGTAWRGFRKGRREGGLARCTPSQTLTWGV